MDEAARISTLMYSNGPKSPRHVGHVATGQSPANPGGGPRRAIEALKDIWGRKPDSGARRVRRGSLQGGMGAARGGVGGGGGGGGGRCF
jgi:hypothetical protein